MALEIVEYVGKYAGVRSFGAFFQTEKSMLLDELLLSVSDAVISSEAVFRTGISISKPMLSPRVKPTPLVRISSS
jgi:hypothetical protein